MKFAPFSTMAIAISLSVLQPASAADVNYNSWYGGDDVLTWVPTKLCFASLRGACQQGVIRINKFAIEREGILYCDEQTTPSLSGKVFFIAPGTGSFNFKCTSKGWKKVMTN